MIEKRLLLDAILRNNFQSFINKCFNVINPQSKYNYNWHVECLSYYLDKVFSKESKRLIINLPPRNLKSICATVAFSSWIMGHKPFTKIIISTYSQAIGLKHLSDIRTIIDSDWYKRIFNTRIKKGSIKNKLLTTENGFILSVSIGGSITGEGADVIIIDDPHNPTHIHSDKIRNKTISWYEQTLSSRLNDQENGSIMIVAQRLHENDLCGYLIKSSNCWNVIKIPIIADQNYAYTIEGNQYTYNIGELLDRKRFPQEIISRIKNDVGIYNFSAQYMQEPLKLQGILPKELIVFSSTSEYNFDFIVQSWDTAIKTSINSDYSVCTTWGIIDQKYYMLNIFRKKVEYPDLKNEAEKLIKQYNPNFLIIEDKASGQSLIQDLIRSGYKNIIKENPRIDKLTRFCVNLDFFTRKAVVFSFNLNLIDDLIKELVEFPNSKHDDIVDSISQFLSNAGKIKIKALPKIRSL